MQKNNQEAPLLEKQKKKSSLGKDKNSSKKEAPKTISKEKVNRKSKSSEKISEIVKKT